MFSEPKPIFETSRLLIREFELADAAAVHSYASRGDILTYEVWGPNSTEDTIQYLEACIEKASESPRKHWETAIVMKETERLIGSCGIRIGTENPKAAGLGYIMHPDFWGQGFTSEAVRGMMEFAHKKLGINRFWATCAQENIASWRVMEKAGMEREGEMKAYLNAKGVDYDGFKYVLDFEE